MEKNRSSSKIWQIFREHKTAFWLSICLSFVFGIPHILIPLSLARAGKKYAPLAAIRHSFVPHDETILAAWVREVRDGHFFPSDPTVFEHKKEPRLYPFLPFLLLGLLSFLAGSVPNLFILSDFIFPPLVFLLVYFFVLYITKRHLVSLVSGIAAVLGSEWLPYLPDVVVNPSLAGGLFLRIFNYGGGFDPLPFSRLPFPQLTFGVLILFIWFVYQTITEESLIKAAIAGLFFGSLFHLYPYDATFALSGLAILLLIFSCQKEWRTVKLLCIISGLGFLIALPFAMNYLAFRRLPQSSDLMLRFGIVFRRYPNFSLEAGILGILFLIFYPRKSQDYLLFAAFFLGGIICLNAQLVLGHTLQPGHWYRRELLPWMCLMWAIFIDRVVQTDYPESQIYPRISRAFQFFKTKLYIPTCRWLIILLLALGAYTQIRFSENLCGFFVISPEARQAFQWLDKNAPPESVIVTADPDISELLPVYTHCNVFLPNGAATLAPTEEITQRLFDSYALFGISPSYLSRVLSPEMRHVGTLFLFHLRYWEGGLPGISEAIRKKIVTQYENWLKENQVLNTPFRADYVWQGELEKKIGQRDLNRLSQLKKVYQKGRVTLYKIKSP